MASDVEAAKGLLDWAKGQPFNNILIATLLGMIGWLGWYSITIAVPSHLSQIQSGYERIESSHAEDAKLQRETFERSLDRILEQSAKKTAVANSGK